MAIPLTMSLLLIGASIGALAMFFYDPHAGQRRRSRLLTQLGRSSQAVNQSAEAAGREAARVVPLGSLSARVQSRLARVLQEPDTVTVHAQSGRITLRGVVHVDELDPMIEAVKSTPGVREIHERLTLRAKFPGPKPADEPVPEPWSPAIRVLTAVAGILLLVMWLGWQGFVLATLGVVGAGMLVRSLTNTELKRVFGIKSSRPKHNNAHQPTTADARSDL